MLTHFREFKTIDQARIVLGLVIGGVVITVATVWIATWLAREAARSLR